MQKFLWGGAVLFMLGAAAAYLAIDYAVRNPASMLARYGVAVVSAGFNSNPLSNMSPAVNGVRNAIRGGHHVIPASITVTKPVHGASMDCDDSANETIEPIQVEAVPQATAEPPTQAEESEWSGEWRPMLERSEESALDQPEKPMPDADVDTSKTPETGGRYLSLSEVLDMLRENGGGCLSWFEYCAPEQIPVMPRVQSQGGEEESEQLADPEWDGKEHQGCGGCGHHGCQGKSCPMSGGECPAWRQGKPELIPLMPSPKTGCGQGNCVQTLVTGNFRPNQTMNDLAFEVNPLVSGVAPAGTLTPDLGVAINISGAVSSNGTEGEIGCSIGIGPNPFGCRSACTGSCAPVAQCLPQQELVLPLPKSTAGEEESEELSNPPCESGCHHGCGGYNHHGYNQGRGQEDATDRESFPRSGRRPRGANNVIQSSGDHPLKTGTIFYGNADDMVSFNGAQAVGSDAIRVTILQPAITQSELIPVMPLPKSKPGEEESEELNNPPCESGCHHGCGDRCGNGYRHGRGQEDVCPDWAPEGSLQCQPGYTGQCEKRYIIPVAYPGWCTSGCTGQCQCEVLSGGAIGGLLGCQSGNTGQCQCQGTCECAPCKCGPTATGCKSCEKETTPTGQALDIVTFWDRTPRMITVSADPEHEGVEAPCLIGRMVLFGSENNTICCEGTLRVTLHDTEAAVKMGEWTFDGEMLQPEKDPLGFWGYTVRVPLPAACAGCSHCPICSGCSGCPTQSTTAATNSNCSEVRLDLEFTPQGGNPLFATSGWIRIGGQPAPADESKQSTQETSGCSGSCHGNCNGCGQEDVGSCCPRHTAGQAIQESDTHFTPGRVEGGLAPRCAGGGLDDGVEESGCHKSCRKTEVVQLYHAKAQDVVTAIQTYLVNVVNLSTVSCEETGYTKLQRDLVLVAEPEGNRILINVSSEFYGELVDMIREIDGQASRYNDDRDQ